MKKKETALLERISQIIFDKKGFNILTIDVRGISSLSDYLVIAEGNIQKHVQAIALALKEDLKKEGYKVNFIEGLEAGDWVVMDFFDVIIHLFIPAMREKYALEDLFAAGKVVDCKIKVENRERS